MLEENNEVHRIISLFCLFDLYLQIEIIITYYEEKEKQDDINRLQIVKESLLEENEKIKRFKEALKEKLIIYQQRIQFLQVLSTICFFFLIELYSFDIKNTELWSALETQQLQNDIPNRQRSIDYFSSPSDSPTKDDSSHLLHGKNERYLKVIF
jgi:hypothetical protein